MNTKICGFIAFLLVAASALLLGFTNLNPSSQNGNASLLGLQPSQVIEQLGVPESVCAGAWGYGFSYPSESGEAEETVWFHQDCAFWVKPGFSGISSSKPVPREGVYPGQPIRELVQRLGSPKEIISGQNSVTLNYRSGEEIDIAHGMVVSVKK